MRAISADMGSNVAPWTSTTTSYGGRPYRSSEITAKNTPSRAQRAAEDSESLAGVGAEGVPVSGRKVTASKRSATLVGRCRDALACRCSARMCRASDAMVGRGIVLH